MDFYLNGAWQGKAVSETNVFIAAKKILDKYTVNSHDETGVSKEPDKSCATKPEARLRLDRLDRSIEVQNACDCIDMENPDSFRRNCNFVGISPATYSYLVHSLSRNDAVLNLRNLGIGPTGAYAVTHKLMKDRPIVKELDLSSNDLGDSGTATICKFLTANDTVLKVDLSRNAIQRVGADAIARMLAENRKLETLLLSHNALLEDNFELLASELHTEQILESLDLSSNSFTSKCGYMFSSLFAKNISLATLNLSCNYVGNEGIRDLVPGLKQNRTIRNLDLSWNSIGDEGVAWMAEFLTSNNVLRRLNLSYNGVTGKGIKCLAESISMNSSLEFLELSGNSLLSEDAVVLMQAILKNPSLKLTRLYLGEVTISAEFTRLFVEIRSKYNHFEVYGMVNRAGRAIKLTPQKKPFDILNNYIANNNLRRFVSFSGRIKQT